MKMGTKKRPKKVGKRDDERKCTGTGDHTKEKRDNELKEEERETGREREKMKERRKGSKMVIVRERVSK